MKTMPEIEKVFDSFNNLTSLIIGDVMIDSYMWGKVDRISPEAPVPVVAVNKKENRLGGAANVALNIQAMGATPIVCSIIGDDENSDLFMDLLKKHVLPSVGIMKSKNRKTTAKTRIIGGNHQMLRVDEEIDTDISEKESEMLAGTVIKILNDKKIDVIIFQDYDKGLLTPAFINRILAEALKRNVPVAVDPKKKNFFSYKNIALFKPNLKELRNALNIDIVPSDTEKLKKVVKNLQTDLNIDTLLVTLSDAGIFISNSKEQKIIMAHRRDISDVSGAGDTVIAIAALCLALKIPAVQLAVLSNLAGGLVCEKIGVVPVDKKQLIREARVLFSK